MAGEPRRHGDGAAHGSLPRLPARPWVASQQYSMRFILSRDNEILWRCDFVPMPVLKAMVDAANAAMEANAKLCNSRP